MTHDRGFVYEAVTVEGNPYRFSLGQTGNPKGRPKGASLASALSRQALKPVADREEMA